jgi:branched-chain amino acid transport system substrate-binding protein
MAQNREETMKSRLTMLAASLVATLAFAPRPAPAADNNYHLGALFPMSGPMTVFGELFRSGTELALKHVKEDKLLSKPLVIDYEDSQGQPQPAVVAMNKLVKVLDEPYVLTAMSGISKAVAPIADRAKVVAINGGAVSPDLATLSPYFFNVIPLVNFEVRELLPYLKKERKISRIALVYVEDPLGESCLRELKENVGKNGQELVGAFSVPLSARQFGAIAAKVRETKPDAVYVAYFGQQQIALIKQLRDNGVDKPFVGYSSFGDPQLIALPAAEGSIYTSQKMDWSAKDAATARFVKDYEATHGGKQPSPYTANYYNAVMIYAQTLHGLEKKKLAPTGENIRKEMHAIKTFHVVGGTLEFQPDGTVHMPIQINLITGGKATILR